MSAAVGAGGPIDMQLTPIKTKTVPAGDVFRWHRALRGNVPVDALGLALVLSSRMNPTGEIPAKFRPGLDRLAIDLGYAPSSGRRSVVRLSRQLEAAGFLEVTRTLGGRHIANGYLATIPARLAAEGLSPKVGTVAAGAEGDGQRVLPRTENRAPGHPHPSLPNQSPSPVSASTAVDLLAQRQVTDRVMNRVWGLLGPEEGDRLVEGIRSLRSRSQMRERILRLVADGWEDELVEAMTRPLFDGSVSAYAGCEAIAQAASARVRRLDEVLNAPSDRHHYPRDTAR